MINNILRHYLDIARVVVNVILPLIVSAGLKLACNLSDEDIFILRLVSCHGFHYDVGTNLLWASIKR
jgi:hypothetical protein